MFTRGSKCTRVPGTPGIACSAGSRGKAVKEEAKEGEPAKKAPRRRFTNIGRTSNNNLRMATGNTVRALVQVALVGRGRAPDVVAGTDLSCVGVPWPWAHRG